MKAAICFVSLAILAGALAAPFAWDPNTVYQYRIQSRFAAGMLGLDGPAVEDTETDRALIELIWKADVFQTTSNKIFMMPHSFRVVMAKEKIHPREEPISSQKEVSIPQKYRDILRKIMIVTLDPKSGVPDSIMVRGDDPLTVLEKNIKRAQVQAFILNPGTAKLIVKGNINRQTNSVRPSEQDDDSGFFYKVMEESIHGECQTYYHVSQTGPFQSLYQMEAQDVPVQDDQDSSSQSNEQQVRHNPRFPGMQKQQWQQRMQQQQWQQQQHLSQSSNEVNQNSEQQAWPNAFKQYCDDNDQIYVIQKTVNLTACKERPVLATMMPPELLDCRPGDNNCGSLWTHVVNTRFVTCGKSRNDFTILEVNQEERFVYGLRPEENIDGYAVKNVTLHQMVKTSTNPCAAPMVLQGRNEYVIRSLIFEFDLRAQERQFGGNSQQQWQQQQQWQHQQQQPHWQQSSKGQNEQDSDSDSTENSNPQGSNGQIQFPLQDQKPSLENPPLRPRLITTVATRQQLQQRAIELLLEAAHNILDYQKSIPERETIALQSVLAKTLRYMTKQEQIEVFDEVAQKTEHDPELQLTCENIFSDAMAASGTNPSLVALMELIETERLTDVKAAQLVMTFAHYARHPTKEFLQRFQRFIKHSRVQGNLDTRTTALLAYSTLLHQVCINARTKQTSFSYALYGPFCQPEDTEEFVSEIIDQLQKVLSQKRKDFRKLRTTRAHEVALHLAVLGNIGNPKLVKVVQEILDNSYDVQEKSTAIFSLKNLVRSHEETTPVQDKHGNVDTEQNQNEVDRVESDPINDEVVEKKVLPLLVSVALDKSEHPTVRIAAIQMLVYCTYADVTVWQQLAMSTWFSVSQEVHSFIVSTIKNLAELEVAPTRLHKRMIIKARAVLPLLKPLDDESISKSANLFASGNVQHLNSQFFRQLTLIGSRDSSLPTSIYFRNFLVFGSGAAGVNPVEFSAHFRTIQQVVDKISENFGSSSSEESGEKNQYMQKILDNILTREMKEDPHGSVYINIRNGMQRLWQLENLEAYLNWKSVTNIFSLRRGLPFNYQKTIQLAHQTMEFPTILGLPMSFKLRLPVMLSLRGRARLNGAGSQSQFQAEIDAVAGYKRHAKISLKIPYIQTKIESGIQTHFVAQVPFRITARARSDEPVVVAVTPTAHVNGTAAGQIELATFHRHPYVAIITDELYPTVHNKGGQMTIIRTLDTPTTNEKHMENILGFTVNTEEVSDYRSEKETKEGWWNYWSKFEDPETFAHLGSFGGPLAKYAYRKVVLDVDASQSKTLIFLLAAKRGSGSLDQGYDTDVSSSSSSSSSTSESDDSDSSGTSEETTGPRARQNLQNGQDSSSSSSSSSESNEASNSNENSSEVFRKGRLVVFAILAKKVEIPPVARIAGLVNLLKPEYVNQRQIIFQLSKRSDKFYLRYAQGTAAEDAARSLPTDSNSVEKLANAVINPDYQGQQQEFCSELSAKIQYPKYAHPRLLLALRDTLLNNELNVQVKALLQFAHTCKTEDLKQNEISMTGQLQRGQNMTQWAMNKSPEAQQCLEDEKQGFSVSDDCLTVAVEQAAALNRARLTFQWSDNLPESLQQAVYDARDMVKATYQAHAYHDRFPQNPADGNQAVVSLRITPDSEYWTANVLTNETELQIQNVPSNDYIQAAFPLSALQSVFQNVEDYVYGDDSQPTCQLEGKSISSFDNVVGEINTTVADGCYHLLTADGSGKDTMAIFAKNIGTDNMKLRIILPQTKINLATQRSTPQGRMTPVDKANDIAAIVNGQSVTLPYTVRKQGQNSESNDYVARILPHPSGGVQVLTPKNDIAFDGNKLVIYVDECYRNKTVGMCGDFDGEKVADRRSRKDIPLSDITLLYANYAYEAEGSQCNIKEEVQQQIKQEEALAKIRRTAGNEPSNLRWGNTYFTRGQQQRAWRNQPTQSSSSEETQHRNNQYRRH